MPDTLGKPKQIILGAAAFGLAASSPLYSQSDSADQEEEIFELSPFTVSAEEDSGYDAKHTLAGTRVRTELKDVGSAISVMTEQFLEDTGSTSAEEALVYANNTEVVGQGGNFMGGQRSGNLQLTEARTVSGTRVRGLEEADNLRDFFITNVPWDSYNVDRVDLQRGANSVLFGIGSAAGIINTSVIDAVYEDQYEVELKFDNFGSMRLNGDLNKVILEDELAVRVAFLMDDKKYKQDSAFRDDQRLFATFKWDPKFLKSDTASTSFAANVETGEITRNDPVLSPPVDLFTSWFTALDQQTFDYAASNGLDTLFPDTISPYISKNPYSYNGAAIALYPYGASNQWGFKESAGIKNIYTGDTPPPGPTINGHTYGVGNWIEIARGLGLPGANSGKTVNKSITDPAIFDFYNDHLYGQNKGQSQEFDAFNVGLTQTILDGKIALNLAYDYQDSTNDSFSLTNNYGIAVDFYNTLPDGSPNPFVGMPYLPGSKDASWTVSNDQRETLRGTLTGEFDFRDVLDSDSLMARILGRHVFTGAYSDYTYEGDGYGSGASFISGLGYVGIDDINHERDPRRIMGHHYLSNQSMLGVSSAALADINPLSTVQTPVSGQILQWNGDTQQLEYFDLPVLNNYTSANRLPSWIWANKENIESYTAVWQGYMFGGNVVPMVGWREDNYDPYVNQDPWPEDSEGFVDLANWAGSPDSVTESLSLSGQTQTFSVVGHLPENLVDKIPGVTRLSAHYNQSENFRPEGTRRGVLGEYMPLPTGETTEVGISAEFNEGKYRVKLNKFESAIQNANDPLTFDGQHWALQYEFWNLGAAYGYKDLIENGNTGGMPIWGNLTQLGPEVEGAPLGWGTTSAGSKYGAGQTLYWGPPQELATSFVYDDSNRLVEASWPQAVVDEWYDLMRDSVNAWVDNAPPQSFQDAWNMQNRQDPAAFSPWSAAGTNQIKPTANTSSEGYEFEFVANPTENLNLSMTISKTKAIATETWGNMKWLETRYEELVTTPLGDMMMWDSRYWLSNSWNDIARNRWLEFIMGPYWLATELDGAEVPELREWSGNVTANYSFKDGVMKGTNIGGSVRYIDEQVAGFGMREVVNEATGQIDERFDINNPYYAPSETKLDLWFARRFELNDNMDWKVQLNVRNVFADKDLIPVTVQSEDGSAGQFRIPEPRTISITNTFSF